MTQRQNQYLKATLQGLLVRVEKNLLSSVDKETGMKAAETIEDILSSDDGFAAFELIKKFESVRSDITTEGYESIIKTLAKGKQEVINK